MSYNYGLTALASIVSGTAGAQVVASDTTMPNTAIRVFDAALLNTATSVNLYSGTAATAANLQLVLDSNRPVFNSNAGLRFLGGIFATTGNTAAAGNNATVNYIKEF